MMSRKILSTMILADCFSRCFRYRLRMASIAVALAMFAGVSPAVAQSKLTIKLRGPVVSCSESTIRIKDVADVSGGSALLRHSVSKLDLDEFSTRQQPVQILPQTISYRVLLAGIGRERFAVTGAAKAYVQFAEPVDLTNQFADELKRQLSRQFGLNPESIDMAISTDVNALIEKAGLDPNTISVQAQFGTEIPIGNRSFRVRLADAAGRSSTANIPTRVALYRELVMAKQNISAGEMLTSENCSRVRRPVESNRVRFASFDQVIGNQASAPIQQYSLVQSQAVQPVKPTSKYVVQPNSLVNIHIRRGGLNVTLKNARARRRGQIGETIEFINPKSRKSVFAKVVDASTAVIEM
jgi:flagella basal body P-ring formation protein FlgA